jgi:hypothetical protein
MKTPEQYVDEYEAKSQKASQQNGFYYNKTNAEIIEIAKKIFSRNNPRGHASPTRSYMGYGVGGG